MKKKYINPELEVIKIGTQQMLANSTFGINTTSVDGDNALGREFDDEFDFDE